MTALGGGGISESGLEVGGSCCRRADVLALDRIELANWGCCRRRRRADVPPLGGVKGADGALKSWYSDDDSDKAGQSDDECGRLHCSRQRTTF